MMIRSVTSGLKKTSEGFLGSKPARVSGIEGIPSFSRESGRGDSLSVSEQQDSRLRAS